MSTWTKSTLSQECSIAIGGTPARNRADYWDSDKRTANHWVAISDLHGRYITSTAERISDDGVRNSSAKLVEQGSVLLSFKLTLGRTAIAGVELYTNEAIAALRSDSLDHLFLHYGLQSWNLLGDVDQAIKGATLNKAKLKRIPISFPNDKKVQERIAFVLDTVDRALEQTEALVAKQQRIKTGLMHDLLTRGLDAQGHLRDPSTHRFKDSALGWIPDEWEIRPLSRLAKVSSGITLGNEPIGSDTIELPYLRVANVQDGFLDLSEVKTIRIHRSAVERYQLKVGDVLMNEGGDFDKLGRGTMWRGEIACCLHQNHVFRVRPNDQELHAEFLAAYSASAFGKRYFVLNSKQSTNLASINSTQLKAFPILRPSLSEQELIVGHLAAADQQLFRVSEQRNKLCRLKSGLMEDLLTGTVPVTPLLADPIP